MESESYDSIFGPGMYKVKYESGWCYFFHTQQDTLDHIDTERDCFTPVMTGNIIKMIEKPKVEKKIDLSRYSIPFYYISGAASGDCSFKLVPSN